MAICILPITPLAFFIKYFLITITDISWSSSPDISHFTHVKHELYYALCFAVSSPHNPCVQAHGCHHLSNTTSVHSNPSPTPLNKIKVFLSCKIGLKLIRAFIELETPTQVASYHSKIKFILLSSNDSQRLLSASITKPAKLYITSSAKWFPSSSNEGSFLALQAMGATASLSSSFRRTWCQVSKTENVTAFSIDNGFGFVWNWKFSISCCWYIFSHFVILHWTHSSPILPTILDEVLLYNHFRAWYL